MNLAERETHIPTGGYIKAVSDTTTNPTILYIIGQLRRGGAEQQLYYLIKHLKHQALVISLSQGGYWADPIRDLGAEVIELERNGSWDISRLFSIIRITKKYKPDIVHIFLDNVPGIYGRLAALLTGHFRVIVGERSETALQQAFWYRVLKRLMNRAVSAVVSNSEANYRYLAGQRIASKRKLRCIPNGLELERFADRAKSDSNVQLLADGRSRIVVGTVGSLTSVKSPDVFVRTAARVLKSRPEVSFVHVGEGPLREKTLALCRELHIQDSFLFFGQYQDIPQLLAGWDIFVLTSSSEGLPNVVMEAMATGLPCVVTDAGGCSELVRTGESGFVVPVGNDEALADRILQLLEDKELRESMGMKGRERIRGFDVHQMAQQYRQLYCQVLKG